MDARTFINAVLTVYEALAPEYSYGGNNTLTIDVSSTGVSFALQVSGFAVRGHQPTVQR